MTFISQAMSGRPMTWKNAVLVANAFNEPVFGASRLAGEVPGADCLIREVEVVPAEGRADGGRMKSKKICNQNEGAFVSLDADRLEELRDGLGRIDLKVARS
jgi:hypothetical protein